MASLDYNPITGQLDLVGSGGGSYIDGEVEYHSNLPVTVGTPAVNSAFLVRKGEGLYFISRKPAGIWVRELNNGNLDDWKFAGLFSDLYRDANFRIINDTDVTKELKFDASAIATATTRTLTVPNASGTIQLTGHAAAHASSGSDPLFDQNLNTGDEVTFLRISSTEGAAGSGISFAGDGIIFDDESIQTTAWTGSVAASAITSGTLDIARIPTGTSSTQVSLGDHVHGNLTSDGKIGFTAGLPVVTTTSGALTTLALGTAGQILRTKSDLSGVEFADPSGGGVTGAASSASDVLGVSGANITGVDANADRIVYWNNTSNKLAYGTPADAGAAAASHTHAASDVTSGVFDNARINFAAPAAIGGTTAAAGTFTNVTANNGNFFHSGTGSIRVGANGTMGATSIAIITNNEGAIYSATGSTSIAIGQNQCRASGSQSIAIGSYAGSTGDESITIGLLAAASATRAVAIGRTVSGSLRAQFATLPFNAVYWGGQTTDATANVELNLDATATNRFTIAANTALIADILLIANSTGAGKALSARRSVAIRRDGSNNTSLIGAVETNGTDQNTGSPTWSFTIDADDTNESLRIRVTGAASETVVWRAVAFYRVV